MDVLTNIIVVIILQYIHISNHHVEYLKHTQCYISSIAQVKAMVFLVVVFRCESWSIKKAELQRISAFKLLCWRRLLRVSWTRRRSNWSVLKEINPEYSLEGLMLNLKLQCFGHLAWRTNSLEKPLVLGRTELQEKGTIEGKVVEWHHQINAHEFEQTQGDSEGQWIMACCSPWGCKESDTT